MMSKSTPFLFVLWLLSLPFSCVLGQEKNSEQPNKYRAELDALRAAIQDNFFDKDSGHYLLVVNPENRESKDGYLREFTYIWSLCAMFQAANEIEKVDSDTQVLNPLVQAMKPYYDPAPPVPGYSDYIMKLKPGERYYDDNQWIGITALDAYQRTGKESYLELGKAMYDFMMTGWDEELGGGIYWKDTSKESKNTCSNGPGVLVALQMYLATKEDKYLDSALKIYNWTNKNLQTPSKLYFDNIKTKDESIGRSIFSYNTGTMLQSNLYLYEITGEEKYLQEANEIADQSLDYFYSRDRFRDDYWFNAVLLRAYQHLLKHNSDLKYIRGFKKCLDHSLEHHKNSAGLFRKRRSVRNLVEHGGMLEILARFAFLEQTYDL